MVERLLLVGVFVLASWGTAGYPLAGAVETVRVDVSRGAPRLMADGRPIRARMFWGAERAGTLKIGPEAKQIVFEFSPPEGVAARATMHLRFGGQPLTNLGSVPGPPGDVYLDDVHVVDLDGDGDVIPLCDFESGPESFRRQWTFWPTGEANTVGTVRVEPGRGRDGSAGLHVQLKAPPDGLWPDFHVYHLPNLSLQERHHCRVSFWVRSEPARELAVAFYIPGDSFTYLGGPPGPFAEQVKLAAAAGVDLVSFPMSLPWRRPGETVDWSGVDAACRAVLDANPNALLVPRVGMGAPEWWRQTHPDDVMVWDNGQTRHVDVVVASPAYRHDAAERLAALVEHLESAFGPHVAGYHPSGQNTGEWFYQDTWGPGLNGYSEGSRRAWRRWLQERYATDAELQAAWHDPQATLDRAEVPSPAARRAPSSTAAGTLRDPATERAVIDFTEFQQEMMADCVLQLAHAVRKASAGRKLVVFFYGYVFEFGAVHNGPATSGHYALDRVLASADIDVLCSPISYFDRGLGESGPAMTAAESVALAGKMWLFEDDTSTYLSSGLQPGHRDRADSIDQTNALLTRNTAQCALRNFGTWWMDLGATGWFNDRRMWDRMAALRALDEPLLESPTPFRPEVAAVIHQRSMIRVAFGGDALTRPVVYEARRALGRMGAPYGQYLLEDVMAGRVDAKMIVLLTAWCLTPPERHTLLEATRGRLRVWCYAPGYQEPDRARPEAMRELTGFDLRKVSVAKAWAKPTERGRALGLRGEFGVEKPIEPLFAAVDASPDEVLATYPDGSAAVALRRVADGWSLFVGPPGLTSELLRLAARRAGVHLFTQSDSNVYANGPYLVLHASDDGPLEIDTGQAEPVVDLLSGEPLGRGPKLALPLETGQTRVLAVGKRPTPTPSATAK